MTDEKENGFLDDIDESEEELELEEDVLAMPASVSDLGQFELLTQSIACDMQTLSFHWKLYHDHDLLHHI